MLTNLEHDGLSSVMYLVSLPFSTFYSFRDEAEVPGEICDGGVQHLDLLLRPLPGPAAAGRAAFRRQLLRELAESVERLAGHREYLAHLGRVGAHI